jgi:hypothetical protein
VQIASKCLKKCSTSLAKKKMEIKTTLWFHLTKLEWPESRAITTTNIGEDVVKQQPLYTVGGNELIHPLWKAA